MTGKYNIEIYFIRTCLLFSMLLMLNSQLAAQTVSLPDTNFRNILQQKYPSVMSGDQLDIQAANSFGNDLIIPGANISDLSGVEHFTSVYKINAKNNNLTTLPDLSGCTNLEYLYLDNNQLNNIDFMQNNTTLLQLHLFNNQITRLPYFNGFNNLQQLFLSGNQLDTIPDLSNLVNLLNLQIGSNRLNYLPDLSENTRLRKLHFHNNNIKDVSQMETLPELQDVICYGNRINDLSCLDSNSNIRILLIGNNELKDLPYLLNKEGLYWLDVSNNQLSFSDLLPARQLSSLSTFTYAPQGSTGMMKVDSVRRYSPARLNVDTDTGVVSNQYTWYRGNDSITTNSSGELYIENAAPSDAGNYRVEITNPDFPELILHHRSMEIRIISCMDLVKFGYRVLDKDCNSGTTIRPEAVLDGATSPLAYTLKPLDGMDSLYSTSDVISGIPAGRYSFYITDGQGCRLQVNQEVVVYKTSGCDPVIAPHSAGPESSYFIREKGFVRILDMEGNIIREFNAPGVWDGRTSEGRMADAGYYVITINSKKLTNITVLR